MVFIVNIKQFGKQIGKQFGNRKVTKYMSKPKSKSTSVKTIKTGGVGRPEFKVAWPSGRFTMDKAFEVNGCNIKPKAKMCKLTVINAKAKALSGGKNSFLVKLDEKVAAPSGKGRKREVFLRRSQFEAGKQLSAKSKASNVSVAIEEPAAETIKTVETVETVAAI